MEKTPKHEILLHIGYFLFSWALGFTAYSNSRVIETLVNKESVGLIYGLSAILTLVLSTFATAYVINKLGNKKATAVSILLFTISLLGIIYGKHSFIVGISFLLFFVAQVLLAFGIDIFYKHNTSPRNSGAARGKMVSIQHVGRIMGPILAAWLSVNMGLRSPYGASLVIIAAMSIFLYFSTKDFKDKKYVHVSLISSLKAIKGRKEIKKAIIFLTLLYTFYALMVTYTPIYLADTLGIHEDSLGLLFTIMLVPFVIFGYPIGKHLDTGASSRSTARHGLLLMIIATFTLGLFKTNSVLLVGAVLIVSRIGAVMLETAGDTLFIRSIQEEETNLLGIMRDMQPIGYFIGSLVGGITLYFGKIEYVFYAVGCILLIGYIITYKKHHIETHHENK